MAISWRAKIAGLLGLATAGTGLIAISPAQGGPAGCASVAASAIEATALAVRCGSDVVIGSSRSEYVQVVANSAGRLTLESAAVPQRARTAGGGWADIDLTLKRGKDGLLRPAVSIADVAFSGGGSSPMAAVTRDGKKFTMAWPGKLPAPTVTGDSATYANVLSGVDLVVRATRTGFTHVLVVKTPAAAVSVGSIRFALGGDTTVRQAPDGSLSASVGKTVVAHARPAAMWDSTATAQEPSSARGPGDIARVRAVKTEIAGRDLVLRPHAELLSAAASAYPLYVDPDWEYGSLTGQKWAYATSNNENNTDYSVARVGRRPDGTNAVYRSFFEFPTLGNTPTGQVSLKGKYVHGAYVQMKLTHSSSCSDQYTYMYATPAINATMKASWTSMTLSTFLASQKGHANTSGCGADQGDMYMNFSSSAVLSQLRSAASGNWNSITVGFAARDTGGGGESTSDRWMKYVPENAVLKVEYDSIPSMPTGLKVNGVDCLSSGVLTTGTLTPTLSATYPDADSSQTLSGAFERIEIPAGGMGTVTDTSPARLSPALTAPATAGGQATTPALPTLDKTKKYAFRVRTTDPAPYSQLSPWSGWCQFEVDNTAPNVSVTVVTAASGPGKPGTFKITSSSADVTKFKYGWGTPTVEIAASGSPKTATVTLTVPKFGRNILNVSAVDTTLNEGFGSATFTVGRPSPAVARWGLETYPGVDQAAALADQQPSLAGNTPLAASNVTWQSDVRLVGGKTPDFNGATSFMATSVPVLDTTKSFSVAAWAKLTDTDGYQTVVSQLGANNARFVLYYHPTLNKWAFHLYDQDSGTSNSGSTSLGPTTVLGKWTHVAAVYDATAKTIQIHVDGVPAELITHTPVWNGTGPVNIGRKLMAGGTSMPFRGELADVQMFDRVLVKQDFTGQLASESDSGGFNEPGILAPVKLGNWDFNAGVSCYTTDLRDTCEAPDATGFGRWMALTRGSTIGAGRAGSAGALWVDNAYFPDDGFTESSVEWGRTAYKTGVTPPDGDGLEHTIWQDTPVIRADQSFTVSAWANVRARGADQLVVGQQPGTNTVPFVLIYDWPSDKWAFTMTSADVASPVWQPVFSKELAAIDTWVHLVAVYDAGAAQIRLYVNGQLQETRGGIMSWTTNGPLQAGVRGGSSYPLNGALDDITVYQGAMTDANVAVLHDTQALG